MKKKFDPRVKMSRIKHPTIVAWNNPNEPQNACYQWKAKTGSELLIIVSNGYSWDHVSVSVQEERRTATYEELMEVKTLFFEDNECVMQYHPPVDEHVNIHDYCLHLWRPHVVKIPKPPTGTIEIDGVRTKTI